MHNTRYLKTGLEEDEHQKQSVIIEHQVDISHSILNLYHLECVTRRKLFFSFTNRQQILLYYICLFLFVFLYNRYKANKKIKIYV